MTDDLGETRDYETEPGKLEFPNLEVLLSAADAGVRWKTWFDDFVLKGNNADAAERSGRDRLTRSLC